MRHFEYDKVKIGQINQFEAQVVNQFSGYKLPVGRCRDPAREVHNKAKRLSGKTARVRA